MLSALLVSTSKPVTFRDQRGNFFTAFITLANINLFAASATHCFMKAVLAARHAALPSALIVRISTHGRVSTAV